MFFDMGTTEHSRDREPTRMRRASSSQSAMSPVCGVDPTKNATGEDDFCLSKILLQMGKSDRGMVSEIASRTGFVHRPRTLE